MKKACNHCSYRLFRGGDEEDRTLDLTDAKRFCKLFGLVFAPFGRFRWILLYL